MDAKFVRVHLLLVDHEPRRACRTNQATTRVSVQFRKKYLLIAAYLSRYVFLVVDMQLYVLYVSPLFV